MASPYIIPAPRVRQRRRQRGRIGAATSFSPFSPFSPIPAGPGMSSIPAQPTGGVTTTSADTGTTPKKMTVPIGGVVIVIAGIVILSNLK